MIFTTSFFSTAIYTLLKNLLLKCTEIFTTQDSIPQNERQAVWKIYKDIPCPPFTSNDTPVTKPASGEAKYAIAAATSSTSP
jgi:hypothetical protein